MRHRVAAAVVMILLLFALAKFGMFFFAGKPTKNEVAHRLSVRLHDPATCTPRADPLPPLR